MFSGAADQVSGFTHADPGFGGLRLPQTPLILNTNVHYVPLFSLYTRRDTRANAQAFAFTCARQDGLTMKYLRKSSTWPGRCYRSHHQEKEEKQQVTVWNGLGIGSVPAPVFSTGSIAWHFLHWEDMNMRSKTRQLLETLFLLPHLHINHHNYFHISHRVTFSATRADML